jgi:hypothetical protein
LISLAFPVRDRYRLVRHFDEQTITAYASIQKPTPASFRLS